VTAPDSGLTNLIAADLKSHTWGHEYENAAHEDHTFDGGCKVCRGDVDAIAARALLVVEQHTNGRIAELEAENRTLTFSVEDETRDCEGWKIRAEKAEATIARVDKLAAEYARDDHEHLNTFGQHHPVAGIAHDRLRAALEGEQQ